jgi:hypothetical protein
MTIIYKVRLVLAGMLLVLGGLVSAFSNTDPEDKLTEEQKQKQYEYLKQAKYFEIKAALEAEEITLEEAQKLWKKNLRKLEKGLE